MIGSQYIRGRGVPVRPEIAGEPYYMILSGDTYLMVVEEDLPYALSITVSEAGGGNVKITTTDVKVGVRAIEFDASAAMTTQASINPITFHFTPEYPFRASAWCKVAELTKIYFGLSFVAHRKGVSHIDGVGKWISPEHFFEVNEAEGHAILPIEFVVGTWYEIDVVEIDDTTYYVEINGAKYGPFTKPVVGKPDATSSMGKWSNAAKSGQLRFIQDNYFSHRPETAYDTGGATPIDKTHLLFVDFETAGWDLPFTKNTAGGGSITQSSAQAKTGTYSMLIDTSGGVAEIANWTWVEAFAALLPLNYPVWTDFYWMVEEFTQWGYSPLVSLKKGAITQGTVNWEEVGGVPNRYYIRVYDSGGWHNQLYEFTVGDWLHIQVKELSNTQFQVFVDDVQLGPDATYTKILAGKMDNLEGGDISAAFGALKIYYDRLQIYRDV